MTFDKLTPVTKRASCEVLKKKSNKQVSCGGQVLASDRGQGTLEYLVIIGIVVVLSLVVVGLVMTQVQSGSSVSSTASQISSKAGLISLTNASLNSSDGNYFFGIRNNDPEGVTIKSISVGNDSNTFSESLPLGGEKVFKIPTSGVCVNGQKTGETITIIYLSKYGLTKTQKFENVSIACEQINVDPSKLAGYVAGEETPVAIFSATGGAITYSNGYKIHTFDSNGTFTVTGDGNVEVLVVAGGGGGGSDRAAGGGAGGLIHDSSYLVTTQSYSIVVGEGGEGGAGGTYERGHSGGNSIFDTLIAIGGGGGAGGSGGAGGTGGSGGGGGADGGTPGAGGSSTPTQGNDGGAGTSDAEYGSGGGGGAGEVGQIGSSTSGGNGGNGLDYNISGITKYYAGGGGGSMNNSGSQIAGTGGLGGGGAGSINAEVGNSGTNGLGGGGGGGSNSPQMAGGNGGSGIVVIKYLSDETGSEVIPNLVAHFKMNDDAIGKQVGDALGVNNGVAQQNTNVLTSSKINGSLMFDGSMDKISAPDDASFQSINSTSELSISVWVKLNSLGGESNTLMDKSSGYGADGWELGVYDYSTRNVYFRADQGSFYGVSGGASSEFIGKWTHFVLTLDQTDQSYKLYLNGSTITTTNEASDTDLWNATLNDSTEFWVGINHESFNRAIFNGSMDDVRIYNTALSSSDVSALYNSGLGTESEDGNLGSGLVVHYKMNDDSDTNAVVVDNVNGNNGTAYRNTNLLSTSKINKALSFNGSSDYIGITESGSNFPTGAMPRTVSVWIKTSVATNQVVFDYGNTQGFYWYQRLYIDVYNLESGCQGTYSGTEGNYAILVGTAGTGTNVCDNQPINDGQWHHIVLTSDGTNLTIYTDGQFRSTGQPVSIDTVLFGTAMIGQSKDSPGTSFNGAIDDVRIYDRNLSTVEIESLYNSGQGKEDI